MFESFVRIVNTVEKKKYVKIVFDYLDVSTKRVILKNELFFSQIIYLKGK